MSTIGTRIGAVRKRHKLTQEEFATRLGFSRRALASWEKDQVDPPTKVLIELRNQFDADPEWILLGDDDEPRRVYFQVDWTDYEKSQEGVRALAAEARLVIGEDQLTSLGQTVFSDGRPLEGAHRSTVLKFMRALAVER